MKVKKFGLILGFIITFLILYILQSNFFSWFTIWGVKPNLFVIFVLFIGLFVGKSYGLTFGVIFGLLIDIFINKKIGISAILLGTIGIIGGILDKNFSKDSKITIIGMVVVTTLLYEIFYYIINAMIFNYNWELIYFTIKVLIEVFYNAILTIILYPTIQKIGFSIQDMFKENRILTRYY